MLAYKDKMFREKPYTQCFECIQGCKLKCKKCMGVLVENILATQTPVLTPSPMRKTAPHFGKKHQEREEYVVSSNFELWVQKMREKRSKDYDVVSSTLSKWPHKIARKSRSKIDKAKQPRF